MQTRLASLTLLVSLGCAGLMMLSLTCGQEAATRSVRPVPASKPTRDLSRLKPLERQFYAAATRGAGWLGRMNEKKGRFVHGWIPAINAPLDGDHPLRQAGAAFSLARAACFLRDDNHAALATQAVLALLEDTALKPDRSCRVPVLTGTVVNRVATASLIVLAINELPTPADDVLTASEQLCDFLRLQQQADGSFLLNEPIAGGTPITLDAEQIAQYSGMALCALVRSQDRKPAAWKLTAVKKAMPFYMKWWHDHKHREFALWHSAAYAEAYLSSRDRTFAEAVFEINDWVSGQQFERLDPAHPQWLGGFQNAGAAPDVMSALCAGSLIEGCRVTRQLGDIARHERYTAAAEGALQFLATLQYTEANTQHFTEWYRNGVLVGGFHASQTDGNLRLDYNQHCVSALVQYLRYVAQVQ